MHALCQHSTLLCGAKSYYVYEHYDLLTPVPMRFFCCAHGVHRPSDIKFSDEFLQEHGLTSDEAVQNRFRHDTNGQLLPNELFLKTRCQVADVNKMRFVLGLADVMTMSDFDAPLPHVQVSLYTLVCSHISLVPNH
jgi:hypothetical protein